jgi:catechol 2,3-dioxygenase-like lactoylglutathione lyase family enzyme
MPQFKKLTPNLLVASVERSLAFYVDTLGFERGMTVPDASPFAFASVTAGPVEIFFNAAAAAVKEYPGFAGKPIGATGTLFIEVEGVDALHDRLTPAA